MKIDYKQHLENIVEHYKSQSWKRIKNCVDDYKSKNNLKDFDLCSIYVEKEISRKRLVRGVNEKLNKKLMDKLYKTFNKIEIAKIRHILMNLKAQDI